MEENHNNSQENAPVQNGEYSTQSPAPSSAEVASVPGDGHINAQTAPAGNQPQPDDFSSPQSDADAPAMPGSTAGVDEAPAAHKEPNLDTGAQRADDVGAIANDLGLAADDVGAIANDLGLAADDVGAAANDLGLAADDVGVAVDPEGQDGQTVSLLATARDRIADLENALVRAQADMENVKRRYDRQVSDAHKYAVERFSLEVLLLRDHMEMGAHSLDGLNISNNEAYATIRKGFDMVIDSFPAMLKRFDIAEIECLGKLFDPNLHEAVGQAEDNEVEAGHVVTVRQRGYTIGERLLRPALVVVAK